MLRFRSIRIRFLTVFLLLGMMTMLPLVVVSRNLAENHLRNLIYEHTSRLVDSYARTVGSWFGERINEVTAYANLDHIRDMDWETAQPFLERVLEQEPTGYWHSFFLAFPEGHYHSSFQRYAGTFSSREFFQQAMAGHKVVDEPTLSLLTGDIVSYIAVPVISQGEVIGVFGAAVDLTSLNETVSQLGLDYPGSHTYVVNREGMFVTNPDQNKVMADSIASVLGIDDQLFDDVAAGTKTFEYGNGPQPNLAFFEHIPGLNDWSVVVTVPGRYAYEHIITLLRYLSTLVVLLSVVLAVAALWYSRKMANPIVSLSETFTRGCQGDLSVRALVDSDDELGQLQRNFNRLMERIGTMTYYDPITKLPNLDFFNGRLEMELEHRQDDEEIMIMMANIDKFTNVKVTFGHAVANDVLKAYAERVQSVCPEKATVARMGEDSYLVLLPYSSVNEGARLAKRLLAATNQPLELTGVELHMTCSLGMAVAPSDGTSASELIKNAEVAVRNAKTQGEGSYQLFDPHSNARALEVFTLDSDLRRALRNHEFEVFYQPIIDIKEGSVIGKEALVRWRHPEKGLLTPGSFIRYAEESGLIIPIGDSVLKQACEQHVKWKEQFHSGALAVNISARQFEQPHFLTKVTKTIEETGIEPEDLILEITETLAMVNLERTLSTLQALKRIGVRLAMDDFGTGYSSLKYLRQFELDILKIDGSFIQAMHTEEKGSNIVRAIIELAYNLDLAVVAEGVETVWQLRELKKHPCQYVQGYLFAGPMPATDFRSYVQDWVKNPPAI